MSSTLRPPLLDAAVRSGLLSSPDVDRVTRVIDLSTSHTDHDLAARLVEEHVLTRYQADLLLAGRGEECVLAGRYQVLEPLGAGGMGAVFKAHDIKLDRIVALKVMSPQHVSNAEAAERFRREAKALAKVSHPGIVQAYDTEEDRGRQFLVMEYVDGHSLLKVLEGLGRLPGTLAADYIYQAAVALHHAHGRGLIHRDIKPANLLLTPERRVKLLDLGLARFVQDHLGDAGLTRVGIGMGTPDYMAPEQFRDAHSADARADIYALGCSLYHLLTGHVPFPGSSLSAKAEAHQGKEPSPIEAKCPDAPAGLVCTVHKMMAKKPADRFQTAGEVAEALAPYVASSSVFAIKIKETTAWEGSQLSFVLDRQKTQLRPRRKRWLVASGGAAVLLILGVAAAIFLPGWLTSNGSKETNGDAADGALVATDPNILTVSREAKDGGQHRTISAALAQVKEGQTIRVLDSATYAESVLINNAVQHARITLEATGGAALTPAADAPVAVYINRVPRVTVRGFRIEAKTSTRFAVAVTGESSGALLDQLDIRGTRTPNTQGIIIESAKISDEEPPVVVRRCLIQGTGAAGIHVSGRSSLRVPNPLRRVVVHENRLTDCSGGVALTGSVQQVQILGNLIRDALNTGVFIEHLFEDSRDVLIANNTISGCGVAVSYRDTVACGHNLQLWNNLITRSGQSDMVFLDSGDTEFEDKGPGDVGALLKVWSLRHNWREGKKPTGARMLDRAWIPPTPEDWLVDKLPAIHREGEGPQFLRPAKDSPLATAGAGGDLPKYVGAVPPEGVEPWDWQKTWESRHPKMLLTVSKDAKDGGEFRTIGAALAKVSRPRMTIHVLDDATYQEIIHIGNPALHEGLTLMSSRRATLAVAPASKIAVTIINVPHVSVRGFRIRLDRRETFGVLVGGLCPGLVLEDLHCNGDLGTSQQGAFPIVGISLEMMPLAKDDEPAVVRNCRLTGCGGGIQIVGAVLAEQRPRLCRRLVLRDNEISNASMGILVTGLVSDLQIVGNKVWNCAEANIVIRELFEGSAGLLIANNSLKNVEKCLEINVQADGLRNIEFRNNLIIAQRFPDLAFSNSVKDQRVLAGWRIEQNWRQVRPPDTDDPRAKEWIPASKDRVEAINLLSLDPADANFLRPAKDSPLATAGAGGDLPSYVGAVPPEGVEPWDWEKTWRWRMKRVHRGDAESAEKKPEGK